jgi:hypothetical protein
VSGSSLLICVDFTAQIFKEPFERLPFIGLDQPIHQFHGGDGASRVIVQVGNEVFAHVPVAFTHYLLNVLLHPSRLSSICAIRPSLLEHLCKTIVSIVWPVQHPYCHDPDSTQLTAALRINC